jgi:Spy/CpxP family protein refolding chaperone
MKRIIVLTLALAITGLTLSAQQTRETKHKKGNEMHHGQKREKGKMMKELNLTDAQKAQMKAEREAGKAKIEALEKQENLTVKEMKDRKAALQQEQKAKMETVLTPEQKNKREAQKNEMKEKHAAMMKEKLGLSNEQAANLKAHNDETHSKLKAIRDNQSLNMEQKKEQMKAVKEASKTQRKNILTAEQMQKMEDMKKEGKGRKGNKGMKRPESKK